MSVMLSFICFRIQVYAKALLSLDVEHALVVHCGGLDELAPVAEAQIVEVKNGEYKTLKFDALEDCGVARC